MREREEPCELRKNWSELREYEWERELELELEREKGPSSLEAVLGCEQEKGVVCGLIR